MNMTKAFRVCGGRLPKQPFVWSTIEGEPVVSLNPRKLRDGLYSDGPEPGDKRAGWKQLVKDLKYVRDHCGGRFKFVFAFENGGKRSWDPRPKVIMRLESLDETTGAFTARVVHTSIAPLPPAKSPPLAA